VKPGRLRIAFRHLPLTMHPHAEKASVSAECAGQQGQFWKMHDALFSRPGKLDEDSLENRATQIGLDLTGFRSCMSGDAVRKVRDDAALAQRLRITGTPAFLFGTVDASGQAKIASGLHGAVPLAEFRKTLDSLLSKTQTLAAR
jgi:protein-disulfide isomerase